MRGSGVGGVRMLAAGLAMVAGLLSGPSLAQQASAKPAAPALTNYNLNAVGTDTTFCVDGGSIATPPDVLTSQGIFGAYGAPNASTGDTFYNTAPSGGINLGCQTTPASQSVPADTQHATISYSATGNACTAPLSGVAQPWLFPSGSSAGINCLVDDQGAGNIALARSSRGRNSSDPVSLEFWAFALDAVDWTHPAVNTHAPLSLTPAQLVGIYQCTITNWSQVGGTAGTISRYYPQQGSGTGDFFGSIVMNGFRPSQASPGPCGVWSSSNTNGIHFVPENDGTQIAAIDAPNAILVYSYAVWRAQRPAPDTDVEPLLHNGTVLGSISGTTAVPVHISEVSANTNATGGNACTAPVALQFCATRFVYHVTWSAANGPGLPAAYYAAVINLVGVPHTGASDVAGPASICSNAYAAIINRYGFRPLLNGSTFHGQAGETPVTGSSHCREY